MSRTLLIGRAGAGKTHRVVEAVRTLLERGDRRGRFERFAVLVPTYSQAEHLKRRLLRGQSGLPALLDRGIGTFEQLAERETGTRLHGLAPPAVQDALLRRALDRADVPAFRAVRDFPGFRAAALRFVKEVKASEVEPGPGRVAAAADRIAAAAAALPPTRASKVAGLARVLTVYQEELSHAGLLDHGDLLHALLLRLRDRDPDHERLALFAVDGFTDLTQVQERIVQLLVERSDEALVTLLDDPDAGGVAPPGTRGADDRTDDPGSTEPTGPFGASRGLRGQLVAGSRLVPEPAHGGTRLSGDLARVERAAAGDDVTPAPADGSVRLVAGADPADEADRVARLCRRYAAEGVPRRDILVVVRRINGPTGTRVLAALRRHGVPHRSIGGTPLLTVPVARSALRLLLLLAGDDEGDSALLALASGDARGVPDVEADRLVQRARETGVRALADLHALADALACADAATWLADVREVRARARPGEAQRAPQLPTPVARHRDARAGVRDALAHLPRLLVASFEGAAAGAGAARAATDAAALRRVRDLVAEALEAERVGSTRATALDVLRAAATSAADARTRAADRRLDAVNVVDAEEARTWEASVVLVAGLRMGEFPVLTGEDVFVRDVDREALRRSTGVRLPTRLDRALRRERLLFYSAVTRASERLVLLTSMTNDRGERAAPSPFFEVAASVFPEEQRIVDGAERAPGDVRPAVGEAFGTEDLLRGALAALSEQHAVGSPGASRQDTAVAVLQSVVASATPVGGALPRQHPLVRAAGARLVRPAELPSDGAARAYLATSRPRSASSLQDAAQCAFRHFARKGLGLSDRPAPPEDGVNVLVQGQIAHAALEALYGEHAGRRADDESVRAVVSEKWASLTAGVPPSFSLARLQERIAQSVLDAVHDDTADPPLPRVTAYEVEFPFGGRGEEGSGSRPVVIAAPDGTSIALLGAVDRVDRDAAGNAVVLDYKLSRNSRYAGLADKIASGLDLQLPLYALAVQAATGLRVVGAAYLTLLDRGRRWIWLGEPGGAPRSALDWSEDPAARLGEVAATVSHLERRIRSGTIVVSPLDPDRCRYCAYADLCRLEEQP